MHKLEFGEIQGLVFSAYGKLPKACYVCLQIVDRKAATEWLSLITDKITLADSRPVNSAVNVAFSYAAFDKLGLAQQALKGFSREFQEGLTGSEYRSRILGDTGESAPAEWAWGNAENAVDILLLLYAHDEKTLDEMLASHRQTLNSGVIETQVLMTSNLPDAKEHFGFRDGISQPKIAGVTNSTDPAEVVKAGEFVLGYENEHEQLTMGPRIDPIQDPDAILPVDILSEGLHDFSRNGCYLVFRQLEQNVRSFWQFVNQVKEPSQDAIALASKMVGRWPSGAPLIRARKHDDPTRCDENDFRYERDGDSDGSGCPIGSHIRRTNPRDSLAPKPGSSKSLAVNRRHRILRRGRPYGAPLHPKLDPSRMADSSDEDATAKRGLHFLCINANLSRQFEFVQHAWINNGHFAGLQAETDPIMGARSEGAGFSIQATPLRQRVEGLPRFVTVRGGGYFFMPSRCALEYLQNPHRELASPYAAPASPAVYLRPSWSLQIGRLVNRGLEETILLTRRLTSLRRWFDAHLRDRIVNLVQWFLRRSLRDSGLAIAEEHIDYREAEITQRITEHMTQFLFNEYPEGNAERAGNTKTYGLVKARMEIAEDLDPAYQVGVFEPGRVYAAYVRFGGPGPRVTPDIRNNGIMSLGIKLMNVEGEKCFDDEQMTQDFTAISAPTFTTPTVFENLKLQRHIGRGTPVFYFMNPFDSHFLDAVLQGLYAKAHANPLETPFWSCVPYLFGEGRAFKFQIVPQNPRQSRVPRRPSDDYLREALRGTLGEGEWCFDFYVQLQTNPVTMPLENSSIIWSENESPKVKVATLRIPQQQWESNKEFLLARELSFNPWHCLRAHRPLGNQGRARKYIYNETSKVRQRIRGESRREPTGDEL